MTTKRNEWNRDEYQQAVLALMEETGFRLTPGSLPERVVGDIESMADGRWTIVLDRMWLVYYHEEYFGRPHVIDLTKVEDFWDLEMQVGFVWDQFGEPRRRDLVAVLGYLAKELKLAGHNPPLFWNAPTWPSPRPRRRRAIDME